jgi:hypothetical protein
MTPGFSNLVIKVSNQAKFTNWLLIILILITLLVGFGKVNASPSTNSLLG